MVCVRRVWLELDGRSVELHDEAAGYYCTEFDPGSPEIRDVTNNRPDAHGIDDHTQFFGARVVSAAITAVAAAGAQIDQVAAMFGPYMVPNVRPVLHYVLDRPGLPERALVVRAAQYAYVVNSADTRDVLLQFVASDPVAYDPVERTAIAWAGSSGSVAGRVYNLRYNRTYPAGSSSPTPANLTTPGDLPVAPVLRLYGPATGARVTFTVGGANAGAVGLVGSYVIAAGHYVEIDTDNKTAFLDGNRASSVLTSLDWNLIVASGWPRIAPGPTPTQMAYTATSTTSATQAVAYWHDGYLS